MKFIRLVYLFSMFCIIVSIFNSCKNPMEVEGEVKEVVEPAPPFIEKVVADEGNGTHYINGYTRGWMIDGQQYRSIAGVKIDTSGSVHRIWISGQCFTKPDGILPNKKELSAVFRSIRFNFDSLALSEIGYDINTKPTPTSEVDFFIKRSILTTVNGKRVQDTLTENVSTKRDGFAKGVVTARFIHLPNNPSIPYKYQAVLEIAFSLSVDLERLNQESTEYPIRGRVRMLFNYGEHGK